MLGKWCRKKQRSGSATDEQNLHLLDKKSSIPAYKSLNVDFEKESEEKAQFVLRSIYPFIVRFYNQNIVHTRFIRKIIQSLFCPSCHIDQISPFLPEHERARFNAYRFLHYEEATLPIEDRTKARANWLVGVNNFFSGFDFVTERVWPAALLVLLSHDLYCFEQYPLERYGNALDKIFVGGSLEHNRLTWSSYLASDLLPGQGAWYWLGAALLLGLPTLFGLKEVITYRNYVFSAEQHVTLLNSLEKEANFLKDFWRSYDFCGSARDWHRLEMALLWNGNLESASRVEYLNSIIKLAESSSGFTQLRALSTLARICDSFQNRLLQEKTDTLAEQAPAITPLSEMQKTEPDDFSFGSSISNPHQASLQALQRQSAYKLPRQPSNFTLRPLPRYLYANYLLWTLGKQKKIGLNTLYWLFSFGLLYAKYRFWERVFFNVKDWADYLVAKEACESVNKIFRYMEQIAQYECTVCGDWLIYYKDMFAGQTCLDGLLVKPQPVQTILQALQRVSLHPPLQQIDFSHQAWFNWSAAEWEVILNTLTQEDILSLNTLNLSVPVFNPAWLEDRKIKSLVTYLKQASIQQLDFHNQGFGTNILQTLIQGVGQNATQYLDLSHTLFTDAVATELAQILQDSALQFLILSNNYLSDYGLLQLADVFINSTLTRLDIRTNRISSDGMSALASALPDSVLTYLDVSFNDLSDFNFSELGLALAHSQIVTLKMSACSIDDFALVDFSAYLPKASHLKELVLADNYFTDQGLWVFSTYLPQSNLSQLILSANQITDFGISGLAQHLTNSTLQELILNDLSFGIEGLENLLSGIINSRITSFSLAKNSFGDDAAIAIAKSLTNGTWALTNLDLSDNEISATGGLRLVEALPATNITTLNLAANLLTQEVGLSLARVLLQSKITCLDISHNQLTSVGTQAIVENLPQSCLRELYLSANQAGDQSAVTLAENLITEIPEIEELSAKHPNRDFLRVLRQAAANTDLRQLALAHDEIADSGVRALCRVLPETNIDIEDLKLAGNLIPPEEIDILTCQTSAASRPQPWFIHLITGLQGCVRWGIGFLAIPLINNLISLSQRALSSGPQYLLAPSDDFQQLEARVSGSFDLAPQFSAVDSSANDYFPNTTIIISALGAVILFCMLYRTFATYPRSSSSNFSNSQLRTRFFSNEFTRELTFTETADPNERQTLPHQLSSG